MQEGHTGRSGEIVKFTILVLILLGTVIVIALLRPFIFERVVPAIIGTGLDPVVVEVEEDSEATTAAEEEAEPEAAEEAAPAVNEEEVSTEEEAADNEEEAAAEAETPPDSIKHEVVPGQTLSAISRLYNVPIADIVSANNIPNPNQIQAGTILTIPQP